MSGAHHTRLLWSEPAPRRFAAWVVGAVALHALLTLLRFREHEAPPAPLVNRGVQHSIPVTLEETAAPAPTLGAPAGGGSERPLAEKSQASRIEQRVPPERRAPSLRRAALARPLQAVRERAGEAQNDRASPELATVDESDFPIAVRPRSARKTLLGADAARSAQAPDAALRTANVSGALGSGVGNHGGPGGNGRGDGSLIRGKFAFGGPSGAFRADICFIPHSTSSVSQIADCAPTASFYTNALDVSPRRFTEGFPGLGSRTEWFALKYRGKFTVTKPDYYTFRLLSDDGSLLSIDGYPIIDNDGQHAPWSMKTTITLEAGEHEFALLYYQGPAEFLALQLFVTPFNGSERLFGPVI